jgi:TrmH family RNA methyltransferase
MTAPGRGGEVITSAANPRVRAALTLRERRGRSASGRLLVDGSREVLRALEAGLTVREAFVAPGPLQPEAAAVVARLAELGVPLVGVAGAAWSRLAYGERGSEVVAVVDAPPTDLAHVDAIVAVQVDPLLIVVEDAEKPGNLGAIARSADGAGATALLVAVRDEPAADPWNPNAVRSSLGTVLSLPITIAPTRTLLPWLRERLVGIPQGARCLLQPSLQFDFRRLLSEREIVFDAVGPAPNSDTLRATFTIAFEPDQVLIGIEE